MCIGTYLLFDTKAKVWARSGKTSGQPFKERFVQHGKAASLKRKEDRDKKIYHSYPSGKVGEKGMCEWLEPYVGIGWLPNNLNVKNTHLSDFWVWKSAKNYFNNKSESFVNENKIILATHLIESSYDLMLSSVDNVSESPGFEKHAKQNH